MNNKSKQVEKIWAAVFITTFWVTTMAYFWIPQVGIVDQDKIERRELASKPEFHLMDESAYSFPSRYEAYFTDHFPIRNRLLNFNIRLQYFVFGHRMFPQQNVAIGKDGWMFSNGEGVTDICQKTNLFSSDQLEDMVSLISQTNDFLQQKDVRLVLTVIPIKCFIYPEYLPQHLLFKIEDISLGEQFGAYLVEHSNVEFVDLSDSLMAGKHTFPVFYRTDIHWNKIGTYYGYREIVQTLIPGLAESELIQLEDIWNELNVVKDFNGNFNKDLGLLAIFTEEREIMNYVGNVEEYEVEPGLWVMENLNAPNNQTLVVFHDSFGNPFFRLLLSAHFQRVVSFNANHGLIWDPSPDYLAMILERWKPNIILVPRAEWRIKEFGISSSPN